MEQFFSDISLEDTAVAPQGTSFDGASDVLNGQSFSGSHLQFDIYYVSGTMPFGLPTPITNTWVHIDVTGSYTVQNIMQNCKGRMANLTLDNLVDMPMHTASEAHINLVGANFVQNGTLATADRGANQDNCVASELDGVDDSLTNTIVMTDSKECTVSFNFKCSTDTNMRSITVHSGSSYIVQLYSNASGALALELRDATQAVATVIYPAGTIVLEREYNVTMSVDMTNVANRTFKLNNVEADPSYWLAYNDLTIPFSSYSSVTVGRNQTTTHHDGVLGEIYFHNIYIADTSIFWDEDLDRPKPIRQVLSENGLNPYVAYPLSADNSIENLGSGGNPTLNGGGLTGARGSSEETSRSIVVDGTNYLTGSILCASLVKWTSADAGVTWTVTYSNSETVTNIGNGTNNGVVSYYFGFSDTINWALEESKNLVTNQLGYPRNPTDVVSESGWTPVLGLFFKDTSNFGANKFGVDYTETGNITAGADVTV